MAVKPFIDVEQDIEQNAGLAIGPGGDKFVLHTTETGPGSLGAVRNGWRGRANWGRGLSHFLIEQGRIVQLLPLTVNAYTMENKDGGSDTNRSGHVVQAEIVHRAGTPWSDAEYESMGRLMALLLDAGIDFDINSHPQFRGANEGIFPYLASYSSPIRFPAERWTAGRFWAGHQHAPENAHWDPGPLDAERVKAIARKYLAGLQPAPITPSEEDEEDMKKWIVWTKVGSAWAAAHGLDNSAKHAIACWGLFCAYETPTAYTRDKFFGAVETPREKPVEDSWFDGLSFVS